MVPVFQDKFDNEGNCLGACIASILELPLEAIPDFNEMGMGKERVKNEHAPWFKEMRRWLGDRGVIVAAFTDAGAAESCYINLSGQLPGKSWGHATVCREGTLIHDPFPRERGNASFMTEAVISMDIDSPRKFYESFGKYFTGGDDHE